MPKKPTKWTKAQLDAAESLRAAYERQRVYTSRPNPMDVRLRVCAGALLDAIYGQSADTRERAE